MKKTILCFIMLISLVLPMLSFNINAEETQNKVVRIAISDDENIIIDRIIYTALDRLGYDVVISSLGMKTAIMSVDNGENDLLAVQAIGIEDIYTNLLPVDVPISYVDMVTFTKADSLAEYSEWDDLNGLRVVYHAKNTHVENHIPKDADKVSYNNYDKLYDAVLNGDADVLVMPVTELSNKIVPKGLKNSGIVQVVETCSFVNKNLPELALQLQSEYKKMLDDGTIYNIKNNTKPGTDNNKIILHISSYSSEMLWENSLVQGVKEGLGITDNMTYYNMSLNLKRFNNTEAQYEIMEKSIHSMFLEKAPDVIIASDNNALDFVVNYYSMLFNNIPVIYCGINNYTPDMIYGLEDKITGLKELTSASETIDEMLLLYPETDNVYILNDYTTTGIMSRSSIENELKNYNSKVNFIYNQNNSLSDIMNEISKLDGNTTLLCGTYYVDGAGRYYSEHELSDILGDTLSISIFGLSRAYIGFGSIIGGKVSDGYNQGYGAAKLVLDVINGKQISELVVDDNPSKFNEWVLDYAALDKNGIKKKNLTFNHICVNKKLTLFESNPIEATLLICFSIFTLILAVIFSYFAFILKRKNNSLIEMQKSLHSAEELLEKDNEIRRSQADFYTLINTVMQPIVVIDLKSKDVLYVNDAYIKTFEFESFDDAVTHNLADISEEYQPNGEKSAELILKNHMQIVERNHIEPFEWNYRTLRGKKFCGRVLVNCNSFNESAAYIAVIQDITADKIKADILQKTADLEREANMLKSQFVMNISHELRTPMNAIIGFSQIALKMDLERKAHEMFFKVNNSAKLLLDLINDVLDFSKIEANKIELFIESFEPENVLNDTLMLVAARIEAKPVDFYISIDENLPRYVLGDKVRLWQVLKNITDNSAKFTDVGYITIVIGLDENQPNTDEAMVIFKINDTGMGMTDEQLQNIYKPFEQFHQSKSSITGTGLGMSITKQIVKLMNGEITISSIKNKGTETILRIPFKLTENNISIKDSIKKFDMTSANMVLFGVDKSSEQAFKIITKNMNISLFTAKNIEAALDEINKHEEKSDTFFVCDISTADVIYGLKLPENCNKILLIPSYQTKLISSDLTDLGFVNTIEKPIMLSETAEKLYNIANKKVDNIIDEKKTLYKNTAVLLVEDNEINQEVATCMLEFYGINPVVANNGQEAIDILEKQQFDLVFMDLIMPVLDGHSATKIIRSSDKEYKDVTIVAMTANVVKEEIEQCIENGMNDHIGKPIEFKSLDRILNKWL